MYDNNHLTAQLKGWVKGKNRSKNLICADGKKRNIIGYLIYNKLDKKAFMPLEPSFKEFIKGVNKNAN